MAYAMAGHLALVRRAALRNNEFTMTDVSFFLESKQRPFDPNHLTQVLQQTSGVTAVHVTETAVPRATVSYEPNQADTLALVTAVQDAGYTVVSEQITLFVAGMTCAGCAFHVESALTDLPGVIEAGVDLQTGTTTVTRVTEGIELKALHLAVAEAGYQVGEHHH